MIFKNQDLPIFKKGNYVKIDDSFISETVKILQPLYEIQRKYDKQDTDTFINEVRDSLVGRYLGFELINELKHGFDGKKEDGDEYLEVKQTSFSSKTWGGTFNDTNLEKAEAFKDKKLYLVVAIWDGMTELLAMVYGQNFGIGDFLEEAVNRVANTSTRSTQSLSVSKLINDFGFKIIVPPTKSKEEIRELFISKSSSFRNFNSDVFVDYDEFLDS
tara:strand:- start:124 stop:771 length:648 start_codon:yes stop_codon:yes gene_type:complete